MRSVVAGLSQVDLLNGIPQFGDDMGADVGAKFFNLLFQPLDNMVEFHYKRVIILYVIVQPSLGANFILVIFKEDPIMKVNITSVRG